MRVLYLTDSLSDLDGVGRYAIRLIRALEELEPRFQAEVLLARKHRPTSAEVPPHWKLSVGLPPDYFYYMSGSRFWPSAAWASWNTWRAARRADLVHAIKDYPHNWVALRGARLAGKPCVATAHGTYSLIPLGSAQHRQRMLECYRGFAATISVSGYTARRLRAEAGAALPEERLHVIPNCVSAEHYQRVRAAEEIGEAPWRGQRYTLAMGELKERKGHHLSLGAFCALARRFPDWHHYLVGKPSRDEYQARLEALVQAAGCAERVHWLGNIDEARKVDLFQHASVFVHTPVTASDGGFEGFGIVYLEASACGVACLGTLDSGAEDAVLDGRTGLLVPQQPAEVERALERLMSDDVLRARLGASGREHALAQNWKRNAERVLAIYRQALA